MQKIVSILLALLTLLIGLSMVTAAWWISSSAPETEVQIKAREEAEKLRQQEEQKKRRALLSQQLQYLVSNEEAANYVALIRAKDELENSFLRYSDRLPTFAEEVTSWKSRYKIAKSVIKDKLKKTEDLEALSASYFEEHVVSNNELAATIDEIVDQFKNDQTANKNRMLSEAAIRIRESDLGIPEALLASNEFVEKITADKKKIAELIASTPLVSSLAIAGSILTEMAVQHAITVSLSATGTTTGAAGGTAAGTVTSPGVGTAVGFVVGAAAGFTVDHFMTKRMKEKIIRETQSTLDSIKASIWENPQEGLERVFRQSISQTKDLHTKVLQRIVAGEAI